MDAILSHEHKPEDDFYTILGCDELSSTEQIVTEYKQRAIACHPDKHLDDPDAAAKFSCLQRAKSVLCDPESRARYDKWLRSGICISFDEWCSRKDSLHTSLHWASRSKKEPMIEGVERTEKLTEEGDIEWLSSQSTQQPSENWVPKDWRQDSESDALRRFRSYNI